MCLFVFRCHLAVNRNMEICHTEATAIMTTSLHRRKCPVQGKQGKYELALRSHESVSRVTECCSQRNYCIACLLFCDYKSSVSSYVQCPSSIFENLYICHNSD